MSPGWGSTEKIRDNNIQVHYSGDVIISHYHIGSQQALVWQKKKNDRYEHDCTQEPNVARESFPSFDSANGCLCQERLLSSRNFATMITCSGRSRPSDKGGGDSQPDPEIRGGGASLQKNFCQSFGPQFGLKIRAGLARPFPWIHHWPDVWSLDRRGIKL